MIRQSINNSYFIPIIYVYDYTKHVPVRPPDGLTTDKGANISEHKQPDVPPGTWEVVSTIHSIKTQCIVPQFTRNCRARRMTWAVNNTVPYAWHVHVVQYTSPS